MHQRVPLHQKGTSGPQGEVTLLLNTILDSVQSQFSQICISLPFEDLQLFKLLYDQTCYISGLAGDRPGLYRGDNYSFHQLLSFCT